MTPTPDPISIRFEEADLHLLKTNAEAQGIPLAAAVRQAVRLGLAALDEPGDAEPMRRLRASKRRCERGPDYADGYAAGEHWASQSAEWEQLRALRLLEEDAWQGGDLLHSATLLARTVDQSVLLPQVADWWQERLGHPSHSLAALKGFRDAAAHVMEQALVALEAEGFDRLRVSRTRAAEPSPCRASREVGRHWALWVADWPQLEALERFDRDAEVREDLPAEHRYRALADAVDEEERRGLWDACEEMGQRPKAIFGTHEGILAFLDGAQSVYATIESAAAAPAANP